MRSHDTSERETTALPTKLGRYFGT